MELKRFAINEDGSEMTDNRGSEKSEFLFD